MQNNQFMFCQLSNGILTWKNPLLYNVAVHYHIIFFVKRKTKNKKKIKKQKQICHYKILCFIFDTNHLGVFAANAILYVWCSKRHVCLSSIIRASSVFGFPSPVKRCITISGRKRAIQPHTISIYVSLVKGVYLPD